MFKRFLVATLYPIVRPAVEAVVQAVLAESVRLATAKVVAAEARVREALAKLPPAPPAA